MTLLTTSNRFRSLALTTFVLSLPLLPTVGCKKEEAKQKPVEEAKTPPPETPPPGGETDKPAPAAAEAGFGDAAGNYDIDTVHSVALFRIGRFGISVFYGVFPKVTGKITLGKDGASSKIALEIDPSSVFTADKKRDTHLKSPDFLDVKQFPKIKFTSAGIEPAGDKKYKVSGELDLHGQKKPVTAEVEFIGAAESPMKDFRAGFEAVLNINRQDFGIAFMPGALADDIRITVAVEAVKKK